MSGRTLLIIISVLNLNINTMKTITDELAIALRILSIEADNYDDLIQRDTEDEKPFYKSWRQAIKNADKILKKYDKQKQNDKQN